MTDSTTPTVTVTPDGPIILKDFSGTVALSDGSNAEVKPMMAFCRCGRSATKPFCDGSHKKTGWSEAD